MFPKSVQKIKNKKHSDGRRTWLTQKIFPHSYNTLIDFDVADEQMNSMNKCDVGPPYANGLFLYTQKTSENL